MGVEKNVPSYSPFYGIFHAVKDVSASAKSIDGPLAHEIDLGFGTVK